jgi:hypothetical protein
MARKQAMFAVSHCRYGVVNQRFKNNCRNGPGLRNGPGTFEEAPMSDDDVNPSKQFKDGFNRFW